MPEYYIYVTLVRKEKNNLRYIAKLFALERTFDKC